MSVIADTSRLSEAISSSSRVQGIGSPSREPKFVSRLPASIGRLFWFLYLSPTTFLRTARTTSVVHRSIAFLVFVSAVHLAGNGIDTVLNSHFKTLVVHSATEQTGYEALKVIVGIDMLPTVVGPTAVALCLAIAISGLVARRLWNIRSRHGSILSSLNEAMYRIYCTGSLILFWLVIAGVGLSLVPWSYTAPSAWWKWEIFLVVCILGIPAWLNSKTVSSWKRQRGREVARLMPSDKDVGSFFQPVLSIVTFSIAFPAILLVLMTAEWGLSNIL